MNPGTIRLIDYWLGIPICALLTAFDRVFPRRPVQPRKMVFLKFIEQGATVVAQDAVARAITLVGRDNVCFCVFASNLPILELLESIPRANVFVISDRRLLACLVSLGGAIRSIRAAGIDTTIDMEFFSRASAIFAYLCGARTRVGLHRFTSEYPYRGDLMSHRVQYNPYLHVSVQYAMLVEAARLEPGQTPMLKTTLPLAPVPGASSARFTPTDEEVLSVQTLLQPAAAVVGAAPDRRRPLILLNPNASDLLPLRKWPSARFVALGRQLLAADPSALLGITGAPSEREAADALCREIGSDRAVSLAGRTTLRELLTLYTLADVLVTNDSGPGHFSSLTPIRTVVLFGPETPSLFGPLSPTATVIWKGLACSPCVSVFNHRFSACTDNVCMQAITVEEVFAAVARHLAASPAVA